MANKPTPADFSPNVPEFPSIGQYQPIYGKFDLTTYIQGASDYEIMAFLVQCYNTTLKGYSEVTKLSKDTATAYNQLQTWVNTWFNNLDVQQEINSKLEQMRDSGELARAIASSDVIVPAMEAYLNTQDGTTKLYTSTSRKIDEMYSNGSLVDVVKETDQIPPAVIQYLKSVDGYKDLSDATAEKIETMARNGELGEVISKTTDLQTATTNWLEANVTPTGSAVVVDKSLTIEGAAADAKATGSKINPLMNKAELFGDSYAQAGFYNNGNFNVATSNLSNRFDVTGFSSVNIICKTDQYYDIYDFLDENSKVLAYERENGAGRDINIKLDVPNGTKYLVVNGGSSGSAVVFGFCLLKNQNAYIDISPVNIINGYWSYDINNLSFISDYNFYLYDVESYNYCQIKATAFQYSTPFVLLDLHWNVIASGSNAQFNSPNYDISVSTVGVKYIGVSVVKTDTPTVKAFTVKRHENDNLCGSRIVWYGTSIPAAGKYSLRNYNSYPLRVGDILSSYVYNEAVGSSSLTCKIPGNISPSNPYGFSNDFELCSRCFTNSIAEMNWIIDHYNDTSVFNYRTVESLSDSDKEFIRSCSYENKLNSYLSAKKPDIFVFDHGYNDSIEPAKEQLYDETVALSGTKQKGWYSGGVYNSTDTFESIRFDVSDYSQILLTGRIGAWRDVYDLFDATGNNIGHKKVNVGVPVTYTDYEIDVSKAKYIVISNDSELLSTVNVKAYRYDRNNNLYCFQGAMRFILTKIFDYYPRQCVVIIGDYQDGLNKYISEYQTKVSHEWNLPIFKQWEEYGWSTNVIHTKYYWENGVLTFGDTINTTTILNCWLADGIHPHSDATGTTLQYMADHIANWLKANVFLTK